MKEAKKNCIKNYICISKEELCIKLWNYMELEDSINMKRISTCIKKASKHKHTPVKKVKRNKVHYEDLLHFEGKRMRYEHSQVNMKVEEPKPSVHVPVPKKVKKKKVHLEELCHDEADRLFAMRYP